MCKHLLIQFFSSNLIILLKCYLKLKKKLSPRWNEKKFFTEIKNFSFQVPAEHKLAKHKRRINKVFKKEKKNTNQFC